MRALLCGVAFALAAAGPLAATSPANAAALAEDAFQVQSTGDLVALCAADKGDPMYTAAQNFCHGFAVGTFRALVDVQKGMRTKKKLFCPPSPLPSRNQAIADFVSWAQVHNDIMALPPTDGILKYLTDQYRCN